MNDAQKHLTYRLGIIVLLICVVYATTITHGFVWDDTYIIVNNPLLEKLGNIPQFFLSEDTIEESTGYYRPITYISFALERAIWGVNPVGYHSTNLVLHILIVLFFYAVLSKLNVRDMTVTVVVLCTVYAVIDFRRTGFWKNDIEFFTRMTKDAPESFVGFKI